MEKPATIVVFILLAAILLVVLLKPSEIAMRLAPQVGEVVHVKTTGNMQQIREQVSLVVTNNIIPIHIDSMFIDVALEGQKVVESNRNQDLDIDAFAEDTLNLAATIQHKTIYEILSKAEEEGQDSLQVTTQGNLFINIPLLGSTEIPVDQELKIQAYRLPEVSLAEISIEKADLPDITLLAKIEVINREPVDITLRRLDYELHVSGDVIVTEGSIRQDTHIPANDTAVLEVPVETSLGIVGDTITQFFEEGTDWPIKLNTHVVVYTGEKWFETLMMDMQIQDTIDVVQKAEEALE